MAGACCFCGKILADGGNDPWPVKNTEEERCCDECDMSIVLPARLRQLNHKEDNNGEQHNN